MEQKLDMNPISSLFCIFSISLKTNNHGIIAAGSNDKVFIEYHYHSA